MQLVAKANVVPSLHLLTYSYAQHTHTHTHTHGCKHTSHIWP